MAESKMPASLTSLIERIEAATEGSRELDIAICQATDTNGYRIEDDGTILVSGDMGEGPGWFNIGYEAPPYSTSIDAALTLLPDGMSAKLWLHDDESYADVYRIGPYLDGDRKVVSGPFDGQAATAPLALLAAILRARQTEGR